MVRELFIRDGRYTNMFDGVKTQSTLLSMVDSRGYMNNSQMKKDAVVAKRTALKIARIYEKQGWKLVSIRALYSYGNPYPFRYDIEAWGGFKQ
jgi:hypothetical protein